MVKAMEQMVKEITPCDCKYCQSKDTRRYGLTKAKKQRWLCNQCHHTFIEGNSLPGMKTPSEQIGNAVGMFYEGLSLNAIRRQMEQVYGNKPSDGTIYEWIAKYSKEGIKKVKDYQPNVGNVWLCDETVLKIAGQNVWFYDVIDLKTRFLLASHLSDRRYLGDARIVLAHAAKRAGKNPRVVVTDSLPSYPQAIGDVFGCDTRHIKYKGITEEPNNNILERFHGTLKARTKIMRGLKSMETAKLFTDGWLVWYNFLRPHESLDDKTPASRAGVKFPYSNWQDIVSTSSFKTEPVIWSQKEPDFLHYKEPDMSKITGQPSDRQIMRAIRKIERRGY
jgi:transposase-like protein